MSDNYDFDDFEDDNDNSPAGLRKALKKAQAEAKRARDELAAEKEAREKAEKSVKKSTLTEILKAKGVKPGLARFLEKDDVEATPEAVDAWVKENGEFFNIKESADEGEQQLEEQGDDDEGEDIIDPALAQALQASQQLDSAGVSPHIVGLDKRLASISNDPSKGSYEDLVAQLAELGAPLD